MNMSRHGRAAVSTGSSTESRKTLANGLSDQFPLGLRVLVVDDDPICLAVLKKMLQSCLYEVTTCTCAVVALSMLRERKGGFDVVISDVHMPDMDGFKLLEHIGLEMDLPVIMMSADDGKDVVMKGVTHGACDYLIKPVRLEALRNIWQHVVRKKRNEMKELEHSGSAEDSDKSKNTVDDGDCAYSVSEGWSKNSKRKTDLNEEEDTEEREDTSALKKPRVVWAVDLHQQFVNAVNQLGIEKAVPKKILELMNVPGLTRENVASHLQKFRLYLKRVATASQHPGGLDASRVPPDTHLSSVASLDMLDLQNLAVSGQMPPQNLATLQGTRRPSVTATVGLPLDEQINFLSSDMLSASANMVKGRSGSLHQLINNETNDPQGILPFMQLKQLPHSHQLVQSFKCMGAQAGEGVLMGFPSLSNQREWTHPDMNHVQAAVSRSSMRQMDEHSRGSVSQASKLSKFNLPLLPEHCGQPLKEMGCPCDSLLTGTLVAQGAQINESGCHVLGNNGCAGESDMSPVEFHARDHSQHVTSCQSTMMKFPFGGGAKFSASSFPFTAGILQEAASISGYMGGVASRLLETGYVAPNCDILTDNKNEEWGMPSFNVAFMASQNTNLLLCDARAGPKSHGFLDQQKCGQDWKDGCRKQEDVAQYWSSPFDDDVFRVNADDILNTEAENILLSQNFVQNDLLTSVFKQQEGARAELDGGLEGIHINNIPV